MRIFPFLIAIAASLPAFASTAVGSPLWMCSIDASLQGQSYFYMRYGRDSWDGSANLVCTSGVQQEQRKVQITFHGALRGFGVNESSVISLTTGIVTSSSPADLQIFTPVYNRDLTGIVWRNESAGISIEANVISDDIPAIQASLQQGNLYIR